ncbi:MAG TPA: type II secretion system protein [Patescibacteria group bacterium]|nr:type II secretion system protein [Patescibacteria group bacterium]
MTAHRIKQLTKGFTLIELLVVIGILGILATALIATIDPFEQLKKASDSNVKNAAVEYINGSLRYDVTHNALPWADTAEGGYTGCGSNTGSITAALLVSNTNCLDALINDGELKDAYKSATNITKEIYVSGDSNHITACYQPQSKSGQRDPITKYDSNGSVTTTNTCQSENPSSTVSCYYCSIL